LITLIGGAAAWPLAASGQQGERTHRVGVLIRVADDAQGQAQLPAFRRGMQDLGVGLHSAVINASCFDVNRDDLRRNAIATAVEHPVGLKSEEPHSSPTTTDLSGVALAAALVVLAAWLLLLVWLVFNTSLQEVAWSRLLVVLGSMEAVAFGAAGALFGTQIQRQRVQDAQRHASNAEAKTADAEQRASANADGAIKGKTLAAVVKARGRTRAGRTGTERLSAAGEPEQDQDEIVALANELFPD